MNTRLSAAAQRTAIECIPAISPTAPLIFTEWAKVRNLASFSMSLNFEPPAFDNTASYLNYETNIVSVDDRPLSYASLV